MSANTKYSKTARALLIAALLTGSLRLAGAQESPKEAASGPTPAAFDEAVKKGVEFLNAKGQSSDGSFSKQAGPGITAIVATALLRNGLTPDDPVVAKSLKYLETFVQPDGSICAPNSRLRNYETCLAVMCLSAANKDGRYKEQIAKADAFLKGLQFDEKDGRAASDITYGGVGYSGRERPDLSNTHYLTEALEAAGNGPDDPAVQRALAFISRCQNLESEHNNTKFAALNPDGGFYYTPAGEGSSPAGKTDNGGLRSYGSMSYAGLKSMIYAGLKADDPRVNAAVEWARQNYSLTENPGLGDAGLYYYYQLFSKALAATKMPELTDAKGKAHDWRRELAAELIRRQQPNGSWINANRQWLEADPNLVTAYALPALADCRPGIQP